MNYQNIIIIRNIYNIEYNEPIVNHSLAREKALNHYKKYL